MANKKNTPEKTIKEILDEQSKVSIIIPSNPDIDPKHDFKSVNINGYRFVIKCGETVEVPESVANILMHSNKQISKISENYKEYTDGSGKEINADTLSAE